jgi:dienelactone hydrolase
MLAGWSFALNSRAQEATLKTQEDVVFGKSLLSEGVELERVMNVYSPAESASDSRPALVFLHGNPGDSPYPGNRQKGFQDYTAHFAGLGYVCFVPAWDLRQGPDAGFEIVRMAIVHIRREAARYGIDTNRVGVVGHSYGSRHACTLGNANFLEPEARANAVIMLAGGMSYPDDCDEKDAPTLLVYGNADEWFPQAKGIRESLLRGNVPHAYIEVERGPHSIPPNTVVSFGHTLLDVMDSFLGSQFGLPSTPPLCFVPTRSDGPGYVKLDESVSYGLYPFGHELKACAIPDTGGEKVTWLAPPAADGATLTLSVVKGLNVSVAFSRN